MELVTLGKTGLSVSRLCFGTLTIGPLQANRTVEDGAAVFARAIEQGVNFCDTAQLYGTYPYIKRAMELTGKYDTVIATKTYAYTREAAVQAVEEARRELNRDYVDIFMLHEQESIHTLNGHADALEYFQECKQKGIIKHIGASMHHVAAVHGAAAKGLEIAHPLINLNGLGIVDGSRAEMEHAIRSAHDAGIGTYAMKALGGGNLFKRASECLQYVLGLGFIDSIAIGMQSADEVDANIRFFEDGAFSREAEAALAAKSRRLHIEDWCGGCGKCTAKCGQNALSIKNGTAVCEHAKCVLCGYCSTACPAWAIKVV